MTRAGPSAEARDAAVDAFLALYAAGRYFDAHEALEVVWRRSPDPDMVALQGLIQWAVAFEHRRRGNPRGARRLLDKAWAKIGAGLPAPVGVDLEEARAAHPQIAAAFARWEAGEAVDPPPAPALRRAPGR